MNTKQIKIFSVFALLLVISVNAQQTPNHTFWRQNLQLINPAYAGSTNNTEISVIGYNSHWNGLGEAPKTQFLSAHSSFNKVGVGVELIQDKVFIQKETNIFANISYKLEFSNKRELYLGLKAGGSFFSVDFNKLHTSDPINQVNVNNKFNPNFGIGALYKTEKYFISLSAPRLLAAKRYEEAPGGTAQEASDVMLLSLGGGYYYSLNENIQLIPALMTRYVSGAPFSFDASLSAKFYKKLELGVNYRWNNSLSPTIILQMAKHLNLGFTYEFITSELNQVSKGGPEFLLKVMF